MGEVHLFDSARLSGNANMSLVVSHSNAVTIAPAVALNESSAVMSLQELELLEPTSLEITIEDNEMYSRLLVEDFITPTEEMIFKIDVQSQSGSTLSPDQDIFILQSFDFSPVILVNSAGVEIVEGSTIDVESTEQMMIASYQRSAPFLPAVNWLSLRARQSDSPSPSNSPSVSISVSNSNSASNSRAPSSSGTKTASKSGSESLTASASSSRSASATESPSASITTSISISKSLPISASDSSSRSVSSLLTQTPSALQSASQSHSRTSSASGSPSRTVAITQSQSVSFREIVNPLPSLPPIFSNLVLTQSPQIPQNERTNEVERSASQSMLSSVPSVNLCIGTAANCVQIGTRPQAIVPELAPSGAIITSGGVDAELVSASDTSAVVSVIINLEIADPVESLGGQVEICLEADNTINSSDDVCLGFLDESAEPPEWICEDRCLQEASDGLFCGSTDHFTNFALLLDLSDDNDCNSSGDQDVFVWLSLGFLIAALIIILIAVALIETKYMLKNRRRRKTLKLLETMETLTFEKPDNAATTQL